MGRQALSSDAIKRRLFERQPTRMRAIVHFRAHFQSVLIRDVSTGGMKLEKAFGLIAGDSVTIELLSGRSLQAKVIWSVAPFCGLAFEKTLDQRDPLLNIAAKT